MRIRTLGYAIAAGTGTFLVGFVLVTESLSGIVEFSVLVGLPAGIVAGAIVTALVLHNGGAGVKRSRKALTRAIASFGLTVGIAFTFGLLVVDVGVTEALVVGTAIGVIVGILSAMNVYLREKSDQS